MSFLNQLWKQLSEQKDKNLFRQEKYDFQTVYKGFRTIRIQQLQKKESIKYENANGSKIWEKKQKKILVYKENCSLSKTEKNGFFQALYQAYINHGQLKITPDDVWMIIMLWFTKYVNKNAEQLRHAFVSHTGQKILAVKTCSTDDSDWDEFFDKIIDKIKENTTKGVTQKLECDFSTTTRFQKLFSTAIIMNTFKQYFKYTRIGAGCGILKIHMGGDLEDWQKLHQKLINLNDFDVNGELKEYVAGLKPVLEQFIETYKGNVSVNFWNNIYHERVPDMREYGAVTKINGWLIKFFTNKDEMEKSLSLGEISVPIKYINLQTRVIKMMILEGGCKGFSVEDKDVYRPHFSFVVSQDLTVKPREYIQGNQEEDKLGLIKEQKKAKKVQAKKKIETGPNAIQKVQKFAAEGVKQKFNLQLKVKKESEKQTNAQKGRVMANSVIKKSTTVPKKGK